MGRTTKTLTVSLPADAFAEVEELAKRERKSKSQLFRDMIEAYKEMQLEREWRQLRRYGEQTARRLGITSEEDIERLVHEARNESKGAAGR